MIPRTSRSSPRNRTDASARLLPAHVAGAVDVFGVVFVAGDVGRDDVLCDADEEGEDGGVRQHQLVGLVQDVGALGGVEFDVGFVEQRVIGLVGVAAIVHRAGA